MKQSTYWLMALAAGMVVANNYYNQPLLVDFAHTFGATEHQTGGVSIAAQAGYTIGLLLFVPLGDMLERRALLRNLLIAAALGLVATALSPTLWWLVAASFITSFVSVAPQLLTPFAAELAGPQRRGKAVATVMFGLLCGILASRTISGTLAAHFGWRSVYWVAACAMVALILMLARLLPRTEPQFNGSYPVLMRSLWTLLREEPLLRRTSGIAALHFIAFSAFWTT
ncbi:MAG: MFS transporter, partial [Nevskiales bacterium]